MKISLRFLIVIILMQHCQLVNGQSEHSFEIKEGDFFYDGKPAMIHSGEMHYARVPQPYWRQRLKMMKAMGLNAVATYVFWNYHEPAPGVWDFSSEGHDLRTFIKTAQEEGLFVILRPGPYACAEWEFGGYPWWLPKNKDLVIRSYNQPFLDSCRNYLSHLAAVVKDLQVTADGPVIMVQVENEFGSYVEQRKDIPFEQHRKYVMAIRDMLTDVGFNVPFYTSDGSWLFKGGALPGILPAANGEGNIVNLKKTVNEYHDNKGPYMVAEYYPGWLDHWGEPFEKVSAHDVVKDVKIYLDSGISFNFYMIHGGTNFGFTSGANYSKERDIQPDITSYDYDAPISEAGHTTEKYFALRDLLVQSVHDSIPAVPSATPVINIPFIKFNAAADVLTMAKNTNPVLASSPLSFEELNQGSGYVLYCRKFKNAVSGKLQVHGLRDYAVVFINAKKAGTLNRINNQYETDIAIPAGATLELLVENMGRINYGEKIVESTKGIIADIMINNEVISGDWEMYQMPFDSQPVIRKTEKVNAGKPVLYHGTFQLTKTGDTFLDMRSWGKGIVFVNGHNLGRYWSIGPQQTLYLPGCWLKKGSNEIVIFEQLHNSEHTGVTTINYPVLDSLAKNKEL